MIELFHFLLIFPELAGKKGNKTSKIEPFFQYMDL